MLAMVAYYGELKVFVPRDDTIRTEADRSLSEREFYIDVDLAEHSEMDCMGGGEYECPSCEARFEARREIRAEVARRQALSLQIYDPMEPTFEERYAPYGIAWQDEQRERAGGGW